MASNTGVGNDLEGPCPPARVERVSLADIREGAARRTRTLDPGHVLDLAESIAALGLISGPVIDEKARLVAGAHRLAALRLIATPPTEREESWRRAFPGREPSERTLSRLLALSSSRIEPASVPVYVLDLDSEALPAQALAIEVAENEKRRSYTVGEVHAIAARLRAAGYREGRGRPRAGEKLLLPALATIIGRSPRTVRRLLDRDEGQRERGADPSREATLALRRLRSFVETLDSPRRDGMLRTLDAIRQELRGEQAERHAEA